MYKGICTNFFASVKPGIFIPVYVHQSTFRLPKDPSTPIIMVRLLQTWGGGAGGEGAWSHTQFRGRGRMLVYFGLTQSTPLHPPPTHEHTSYGTVNHCLSF